MKTVTRSATRAESAAAGSDLLPTASRARQNVAGRSSQASRTRRDARWGDADKLLLICGAAATVAVVNPALLLWLLLPVVPALLLRAAGRERLVPRPVALLRIFSAAALGAAIVQVASTGISPAVAMTSLAAAVLFLGGLEWFAVR